ncbi:hypothetical protein ACFSTC_56980 [Nonomuraea ferruginea]
MPVFNAPPRPPATGRPTAESLDPDTLLRGRRNAPPRAGAGSSTRRPAAGSSPASRRRSGAAAR